MAFNELRPPPPFAHIHWKGTRNAGIPNSLESVYEWVIIKYEGGIFLGKYISGKKR